MNENGVKDKYLKTNENIIQYNARTVLCSELAYHPTTKPSIACVGIKIAGIKSLSLTLLFFGRNCDR